MSLKHKTAFKDILTPDALAFVSRLHQKFNSERERLLKLRSKRQVSFDHGDYPDFLKETSGVRQKEWQVASSPPDLENRRVEITGPAEAKMIINALNSGANVFMADFEDSFSPTWENIIQGQISLKAALRRTLSYTAAGGKTYVLHKKLATLVVRPRGWHLLENHFCVEEKPVSASLFDFGLYFFHNVHECLKRGTAPYFYLPKLESHLEARLWNHVFYFSEGELKIPRGTIRATVLIETLPAAFEMEEILYELRDYSSGLNAGRWDYIFSMIKKFQKRKNFVLPDRAQIVMTVPFMRAYAELLVQTCHKRGAHAIGGMAAFVPSRKDPGINEVAFAKVREDKEREMRDGFDGTWVAHPDLVPVAAGVFDGGMGNKPHQKDKRVKGERIGAGDLLNFEISGGAVTEAGVMNNVSVALQYLNYWLQGTGAATIYHLMEDAATAEIARAQLWQWRYHRASLNDGRRMSAELYKKIRDTELEKRGGIGSGRYREGVELLDGLVLSENFSDFLTLPAYSYLDEKGAKRS